MNMKMTDALVTRMANMEPEKLRLFLSNQRSDINFSNLMAKSKDMWKRAEEKKDADAVERISNLRDALLVYELSERDVEYSIV